MVVFHEANLDWWWIDLLGCWSSAKSWQSWLRQDCFGSSPNPQVLLWSPIKIEQMPFTPIKVSLVGGIPTPLKNMSPSVGMMTFPIWWESHKSHVPNHQPAAFHGFFHVVFPSIEGKSRKSRFAWCGSTPMPSCVQVISTNSTSRISMEARPTWSVHMVVTYNMPLVGLPWITLDYDVTSGYIILYNDG